jgi:Tol biopolymer transport system component
MRGTRIAVLALSLVAAACGRAGPKATPTATPSPSPSASPTQGPPKLLAAAVTYVDEGDLWVWDAATNKVARLTSDGQARIQARPEFLGLDRIAYISNGASGPAAIEAVPSAGGPSSGILHRDGSILDFAASPDGTLLAYLTVNFDKPEPHSLSILTMRDGTSTTVRRFPMNLGRGTGEDDEVSVAWSPDGRALLVTDTHLLPNEDNKEESLFVVDLEGRDLVAPRVGTHGRWSADGRSVYYRRYGTQPAIWVVLDASSGTEKALDTTTGTMHARLSPDGTQLVYHGGAGAEPNVLVFNLRTGSQRAAAPGAVHGLWLSPKEIIATSVRRCGPSDECGEGPGWIATGKVYRYPLTSTDSAEAFPVAITSTIDADVLYRS